MKNIFLSIVLMCVVIGCGSKKKVSEIEEKTVQTQDTTKKVKANLVEESKQEVKKEQEDKKTSSETQIIYKPKINPSTGKFEPFTMHNKKDGKTESIEVNGNGEVIIKNSIDIIEKKTKDIEENLKTLQLDYESQIKSEQTKNSKLTDELKTVTSGVWKLWIWIIILAIALVLSILAHIYRTKIPFLNK